jgi:glutamate-1-semialdehyde 2,1-aminomutase
MQWVAPQGAVYQAGTLSGNPLAMVAGIATLKALKKPGTYRKLESLATVLVQGLRKAAERADCPVQINQVGSMFTVFFTSTPVTDFRAAKTSDTDRFSRFFNAMLERGIYLAPSQFEACFVSLAHTRRDANATIRAAQEAFRRAVSGQE